VDFTGFEVRFWGSWRPEGRIWFHQVDSMRTTSMPVYDLA
jgi:hypothetical protein